MEKKNCAYYTADINNRPDEHNPHPMLTIAEILGISRQHAYNLLERYGYR